MDSEGQGWKDRALNHEDRIAELEAKVKWYAGVVMDYTAVLERAEQAEAELDALLRDEYNAEASMMNFATWKLVALQQLRDRQPRGGGEG